MSAEPSIMSLIDLQALLSNVRNAIKASDHRKLLQIIASVTDGVSNAGTSNDIFIKANVMQNNKIIPITIQNN